MGFFDFLKSKTSAGDTWKKTLVKDLAMLTAVDGDMDEEEVKLVLNIAVNELGFSRNEFINIMKNLGDVKDIYPSDLNDKLDYMTSLIRMTYTDGVLDDNEIAYMKIIAKRMSIPEDLVDKTIDYIENSFTEAQSKSVGDHASYDDSSTGKIIITSPFEPTIDIQTEDGLRNYFSKISKLTRLDLCIELSNIMSAKYNLTSMPSGLTSFTSNQKIVTDLTDKALFICIHLFGRQTIEEYCNGDFRKFNLLVNNIDKEVALLDLPPAKHGDKILDSICEALSRK